MDHEEAPPSNIAGFDRPGAGGGDRGLGLDIGDTRQNASTRVPDNAMPGNRSQQQRRGGTSSSCRLGWG